MDRSKGATNLDGSSLTVAPKRNLRQLTAAPQPLRRELTTVVVTGNNTSTKRTWATDDEKRLDEAQPERMALAAELTELQGAIAGLTLAWREWLLLFRIGSGPNRKLRTAVHTIYEPPIFFL